MAGPLREETTLQGRLWVCVQDVPSGEELSLPCPPSLVSPCGSVGQAVPGCQDAVVNGFALDSAQAHGPGAPSPISSLPGPF